MIPHAVCIFCDDIRFEQQNKVSLIGCYGAELISLSPPPINLPKLGVVLQARFPLGRLLAIKVNMFMPQETEPFFSQELYPEEKEWEVDKEFEDEVKRNPDPKPARMIFYPFLFSSLVIPKVGALRVRLVYGSEVIRADSLIIKHHPLPQDKT